MEIGYRSGCGISINDGVPFGLLCSTEGLAVTVESARTCVTSKVFVIHIVREVMISAKTEFLVVWSHRIEANEFGFTGGIPYYVPDLDFRN